MGLIQLPRVAQVVQFKSLARLLKLEATFVDNLFGRILKRFLRISELLQVPSPIAVEVTLKRGSHKWWCDLRLSIPTKDLLAHDQVVLLTLGIQQLTFSN